MKLRKPLLVAVSLVVLAVGPALAQNPKGGAAGKAAPAAKAPKGKASASAFHSPNR